MLLLNQDNGKDYRLAAFALAAVSFLTPLIVYRVIQQAPFSYGWFTPGFVSDLFSIIKSRVVIVGTMVAMTAVVNGGLKPTGPAALVGAVLGVAAIAAAIYSPYPDMVWTGAPFQSEGLPVQLCYLALMVTASAVMARHWRLLVGALSASLLVMTIIGVLEFLGYPPLLHIPHWLIGLDAEQPIMRASAVVSATLGNADHLGMYAAMLGPVMLVLGLGKLDPKYYALTAFATILILISSSILGGIGLIGGMIAGALLLCRIAR